MSRRKLSHEKPKPNIVKTKTVVRMDVHTGEYCYDEQGCLVFARFQLKSQTQCKDCRYRYIENLVWKCPFGLSAGPEFYCGYAERKVDT